MSEYLEKGVCSNTGSVKEPLKCQNSSEAANVEKKPLKFVGERFRSHPLFTLLLLSLLLLLVLALGVALAVQSGRSCGEAPVTPVTPVTPDTALLLACPNGWVGYNGICYFFSKDHRTWDQGQARCSELGASLAVLKDWEMEFLFTFTRNADHWVGLRRQDQGLQWEDGSSFNSSVPVRGNAECVFLDDNHLGCMPCSNSMPYICSRAQTPL